MARSGSTIGRSPFRPTACRTVPARLFLRPQDVAVVDESAGAIARVVTATHRNGGLRRFDLAIGGAHHRIEIALPAADSRDVSGRIAVLPRRWRIYPAGGALQQNLTGLRWWRVSAPPDIRPDKRAQAGGVCGLRSRSALIRLPSVLISAHRGKRPSV